MQAYENCDSPEVLSGHSVRWDAYICHPDRGQGASDSAVRQTCHSHSLRSSHHNSRSRSSHHRLSGGGTSVAGSDGLRTQDCYF